MVVHPDFKAFCRLSEKGNLIPIYAEILADLETPVSCFLKMAAEPYGFLLESVEGGRSQARYSFLGCEPEAVMELRNGQTVIQRGGKTTKQPLRGDPLLALKYLLKEYRAVPLPELPRFCGGAVGYLSYDCTRFYERIPVHRLKKSPFPDFFFMLSQTLLVFDHVQRKIKIVSNAFIPKNSTAAAKKRIYDASMDKIQYLLSRLKGAPFETTAFPDVSSKTISRRRVSLKAKSNFKRAEFERGVDKIKEHIRRGDVIQTVLSQRFELEIGSSPFHVYRALRSVNPSPYMFYLNCGSFSLVGSSPEVHVRCEDGNVTLRPIAGTRPRGKTPQEDERLGQNLLKDPKERAEHVMLVDLGRNDLGRVCQTGTVKVQQFMILERYSHVMHIVSEVHGKLAAAKDLYDVIRATFPAGTVTGAPKVRAMEIINDLEPERRGPYAGLVGYLSFSGNFDSCITIRTILCKNQRAYIQAGAGIVADSDRRREWMETNNKAKGLLKAIEMAEKGL